MSRFFWIAGCLLALVGVAAGAFGAHGLRDRLPEDLLAVFETGVRYQMYHALALLGVAWATTQWTSSLTNTAGWMFVGGTVIFSGTLYLLAISGVRWLGAITPIGGVMFLIGWGCLALAAWRG